MTQDLDLSVMCWIMTPKTQTTKEKLSKLDFTKTKNFCASKDTINRVKWQPIKWEKIFAHHISDKRLISRIYKKLLKTNNDKMTQFKNGQRS